jgi:sulfoxide reductase heme-binding subunit YedZ
MVAASVKPGRSVRGLPRALKPALFVLALLPLLWLVVQTLTGNLGPNPQEALIRGLGDWTIRLLAAVLLVTPLRVALGQPLLVQVRRMLGLFVFAYATLHLLAYVVFDKGMDGAEVWADVLQRPFIAVGMVAWALLLVLALTSPVAVVRRLGPLRWRRLHQSVYAVAGLGVLHFFWMRSGKLDFGDVWLWGGVLAALLALRLPMLRQRLQAFARWRAGRSGPAAG